MNFVVPAAHAPESDPGETLTPDKLAAKIDREWERWGKVTKAAGMKQQ